MIDSIAKTEYERGFADGRKPQWIPCSERLPEEHTDVLTYDSSFGITFDSLHRGKLRKYPVAWMPLPEPWRGESDGKK